MSNRIEDLREHLFDTLRDLRDKDHPMDLDRAKAVASVAQTIVNSAKVEVDMVKATGARPATTFFPALEPPKSVAASAPPQTGSATARLVKQT